MSSIRSALVAMAATWFVAGLAPAAANPNVTSTDPKSLYACAAPYSSPRRVTLYGSGLVAPDTTGYTINSDVRIMVRHSGGAFAPAKLSSWTGSLLGVDLLCADFSQTVPGSLDFQVVLRDAPGNIVTIPLIALPGGPPTLISVSPSQLGVGMTGFRDYLVRVRGTNMPDDTTATIGSEGAGVGMAGFTDGYMDIWVPADLRSKPGVYAVQLHDSKGASNTVNFYIVGPPVITSVEPAVVNFAPPPPRLPTIIRNPAIGVSTATKISGSIGTNALPQPTASASPSSAAPHPIIVHTPSGVRSAISHIAPSSQFVVKARDIDDTVALEFEGERLPLTTKVLAYGRQEVGASLPDWAAGRCGHRTYSIWLVTTVGASAKATLETEGGPCATPPPPGSLHTIPPH